jgi:predicted nucleotidyltransferase
MAKFPVTLKRRNSIGKVVKVSCSTVKDAIRILQRFRQSGYRDVWFEDLNGNMVDESEFEEPPAKAA